MNINNEPAIFLDPIGRTLGLSYRSIHPRTELLALLSAKRIGTLDRPVIALGPHPERPGSYFTSSPQGQVQGFSLCRNSEGHLINLGIDNARNSYMQFHPDGQQLLWANQNGTISVCNLGELEKQLAVLNLGWAAGSASEPSVNRVFPLRYPSEVTMRRTLEDRTDRHRDRPKWHGFKAAVERLEDRTLLAVPPILTVSEPNDTFAKHSTTMTFLPPLRSGPVSGVPSGSPTARAAVTRSITSGSVPPAG